MANIFKVLHDALFPPFAEAIIEHTNVTRALDRFRTGQETPDDIATLEAYVADKPDLQAQFHAKLAYRRQQRAELDRQIAVDSVAWDLERRQEEDERLQLLAEVQNLKARFDRTEQEHQEHKED